ncbi:MAG: metallophosphoesterase [Bacteroidaceae bacterium]|nr:metallophosphoesterase [Bacteroidaceae bacterium]
MELRVALFFLLFAILPTALLMLSLRAEVRRKCWWLWLPGLCLFIGALLLFVGSGYVHFTARAWPIRLLTAIFCYGVPLTAFALLRLLSKCFSGWTARSLTGLGVLMAAGLIALLTYGFTRGVSSVRETRVLVADERIPRAFDDYKIAVVSDLHIGTYFADTAAIGRKVDAVCALQPDLICFVGDLVNFSDEEIDRFMPQLSRLKAKDGVVSVLGNHDYLMYYAPSDSLEVRRRQERLCQMERELGWQLLCNEHIVLHRERDSLVVVGSENQGEPPFPQRADLQRAMAGIGPQAYAILLTHDPTHWRQGVVGATSIPLTLSGHTHGMQFALMGWSPVAWKYAEWGGTYDVGTQRLCVTTGLGESLLPMRIGMPPEVLSVTLRHVDR